MSEPPEADLFCVELELTQFGRSRSRLRDLGPLEPVPPNKVTAPQHCKKGRVSGFHAMLVPTFCSSFMGFFINLTLSALAGVSDPYSFYTGTDPVT